MIAFVARHPLATLDHFGHIPESLSDLDPRSAHEQLDAGYAHGGGWNDFPGFTMGEGDILTYPNDPPYQPIAELLLRDERIILYQYSIIAVVQPDGSFEVTRMD